MPIAVSLRMKTKDYTTSEWKEFYKTLVFILNLEKTLYDENIKEQMEEDFNGNVSPASGIPRAYSTYSVEN